MEVAGLEGEKWKTEYEQREMKTFPFICVDRRNSIEGIQTILQILALIKITAFKDMTTYFTDLDTEN